MLKIPLLTGCGLFDFKLKFGTAATSNSRLAHAFEIELPLEDGTTAYVDEKPYAVTSNCILCIKPGQLRQTSAPFRCYYIHVHPDNGEVCQLLSQLPDSIPIRNAQPYIDIFRDLTVAKNQGLQYTKFHVAYRLLTLIELLRQEIQATERYTDNRRSNSNAIRTATAWIDAHLSESITLEQMAKEVFLSPIYFRNLFTELVGVSPHVYIQGKRIERARQLLRTTNESLPKIAEECGFSSHAYFGKVFKASTGYTPNAYRIMVNNQYP